MGNKYQELCDAGVFDRAEENTRYLTTTYNKMIKSPTYQPDPKIFLSMPLLMHACISYEIDIMRWIPFHDIKIPNKFKRAGFIFKWISRMHPVRSIVAPGCERPSEIAANSYFALLGAIGELDINMEEFGKSEEIKEILYSSSYRDIQPSCWATTFSLLEKAFKSI